MSTAPIEPGGEDLSAVLAALRPKLHRYCARMVGSVFDGEDVVQDALGKAFRAYGQGVRPESVEGWLMRIGHNAAMDFLRRRAREAEMFVAADVEGVAETAPGLDERRLADEGFATVFELPLAQRSVFILMDLLGYSLAEISDMLHLSVPAVKAALHRGRARLREAASHRRYPVPTLRLQPEERALYQRYVERFNAGDFAAVSGMLAEEVWLDMVARRQIRGVHEVIEIYLRNYGLLNDWRLSLGAVEGRPTLLVRDLAEGGDRPAYFIQLDWRDGKVARIRDFRYARYVADGARVDALA